MKRALSDDDNWKPGPVVPKFPTQRQPQDEARIQCDGCKKDFPVAEINEFGRWIYCDHCEGPELAADDQQLTRELAYATA